MKTRQKDSEEELNQLEKTALVQGLAVLIFSLGLRDWLQTAIYGYSTTQFTAFLLIFYGAAVFTVWQLLVCEPQFIPERILPESF